MTSMHATVIRIDERRAARRRPGVAIRETAASHSPRRADVDQRA